MRYVALLRGINVGGKTLVAMPQLQAVFEQHGCRRVSTYINSGNVLFSDDRPAAVLGPLLAEAVNRTFDLTIPLLLRDASAIQAICAAVPADWMNDQQQKTDVLFLWDEINTADILNQVVINPALERVLYAGGALVWNIDRANVTRGNGVKLVKTDLYRHLTARNINTVRKLNDLLAAI